MSNSSSIKYGTLTFLCIYIIHFGLTCISILVSNLIIFVCAFFYKYIAGEDLERKVDSPQEISKVIVRPITFLVSV